MDTIVVTGDRDSYQLVRDPHLKVLYNKRGVSDYALYDEAGIFERTGVTPQQYVDYAAFRGDKSDNLPGVPGIGEKTAAKLIATYGGLEGIFEHLDDLPPKQRTNLGEFHDQVLPQPGDVGAAHRPGSRAGARRPAHGWLGPRGGPGPVPDSSSSGSSTRACSRRSARKAKRSPTGGTALEATVRSLRAGDEIVKHLRGLIADAGERYVDRAALDERRAADLAAGARFTRRGRGRVYVHDRRPPRRGGHGRARAALVGPGGPPLVAHRAKELMHGLVDRARRRRADARSRHRGHGVPAGSGGAEVRPRAARPAVPRAGADVTRPRRRHARPGRRRRTGRDRSAGDRRAAARRRARRWPQKRASSPDLYEKVERPLVRVLVKMEIAGISMDREFLEALRVRPPGPVRRPRAQDPRPRG